MSKLEEIKDARFKLLGYYRDGKYRIEILDPHFKVLGFYDKKFNETKTSDFKLVGRGNLLATLLR